METSWATNLYDYEGDIYYKGVLLFCDKNIILKFKNSIELEEFSDSIKRMLDNIREYENEYK